MSHVLKCVALSLLLASGSASAFSGFFGPNLDPIKALLKDPYSARFENVKEYGPGVICGLINSKNSMGAYTGFTAFYIANKVAGLSRDSEHYHKAICVDLPACLSIGKTIEECSAERNGFINKQITDIDNNKAFAVKSQAEIVCYRESLSGANKNDCVAGINSCHRQHPDSYIRSVACMVDGPLPMSATDTLLEPIRSMEEKQNKLKILLNIY